MSNIFYPLLQLPCHHAPCIALYIGEDRFVVVATVRAEKQIWFQYDVLCPETQVKYPIRGGGASGWECGGTLFLRIYETVDSANLNRRVVAQWKKATSQTNRGDRVRSEISVAHCRYRVNYWIA